MVLKIVEILLIPAIIFWLTRDEGERGETYEQSEER